jgi:hypothetical protein
VLLDAFKRVKPRKSEWYQARDDAALMVSN